MFQCTIWIILPLANATEGKEGSFFLMRIATFAFDPNLQVGDEINIADWCLSTDRRFNFAGKASITERKILITPENRDRQNGLFEVRIIAKILDKERLQRLCSIVNKDFIPAVS